MWYCAVLLIRDPKTLWFAFSHEHIASDVSFWLFTSELPVTLNLVLILLRCWNYFQLKVKRQGDKNVRCTMLFMLNYMPPQFKLDSRLGRLLGIHTNSRPVIIQGLWEYIKSHKLQVVKKWLDQWYCVKFCCMMQITFFVVFCCCKYQFVKLSVVKVVSVCVSCFHFPTGYARTGVDQLWSLSWANFGKTKASVCWDTAAFAAVVASTGPHCSSPYNKCWSCWCQEASLLRHRGDKLSVTA